MLSNLTHWTLKAKTKAKNGISPPGKLLPCFSHSTPSHHSVFCSLHSFVWDLLFPYIYLLSLNLQAPVDPKPVVVVAAPRLRKIYFLPLCVGVLLDIDTHGHQFQNVREVEAVGERQGQEVRRGRKTLDTRAGSDS